MTVSAKVYQDIARAGKTVLVELREDRWLCVKTDAGVEPHMQFNERALKEIDEALQQELGRDPTEEEMRKRMEEVAASGLNLQKPMLSSLLRGTLEVVQDELLVLHHATPGGVVKVTIDPADVKHVNYVDEDLIQKAGPEALG